MLGLVVAAAGEQADRRALGRRRAAVRTAHPRGVHHEVADHLVALLEPEEPVLEAGAHVARPLGQRGARPVEVVAQRALSGPPGPGQRSSATLALTRDQALELIAAETGARQIRLLPRP